MINIVIFTGFNGFFAATWWLWAFFILFPALRSTYLFWRQEVFKKTAIDWILLELRMPREILKSAQAMEQVLAAINTLRNAPGDIKERWLDGEITRWFSFELTSFGGEVHFYLRTHAKLRNLVEAAIFSYYHDVEVNEAEDYINRFPPNIQEMYTRGYDLWGTEMLLNKPAMYPIKTYKDFESEAEEKQFDPISTFLEVLGKLKPEEIVGIQILAAPLGAEWKNKWEAQLEKLKETKVKEAKSKHATATEFPGGPLPALSIKTKAGDPTADLFKSMIRTRSPGETDVLEKIENNLSKAAFNTLIRFIYLSPQAIYYDSYARRGLVGAFNQYAALNLNSFGQNGKVGTLTKIWQWPHIFPVLRNKYRKQRLLFNYRSREMPLESFMGRLLTSNPFNWNFFSRTFEMNTECLATIFHPPTAPVLTAPHLRRVESRKVGPPAGLPIYGQEEELEKF